MARLVININDAQFNRVIDAVCSATSYDSSSGTTKEQHVINAIKGWLRNTAVEYERRVAAESAAASVVAVEV